MTRGQALGLVAVVLFVLAGLDDLGAFTWSRSGALVDFGLCALAAALIGR